MAQKRDRFVAQVEQLAKNKGLKTQIQKWRGKGGHAMLWVGDKVTTIPSREIDPKTAKKILKALGLD
jgi:predicted RNA binding protein YcfA (HicA-like mRNA interferase family)